MENQLKQSIQDQYETAVTFKRSMMKLKALRSMEMIGISINISLRNIPKMKLSLTSVRLNLLLWILRLRLSKGSLTLNLAWKRSWQSQYRITQLSRSLLGVSNPLRIIGKM